MTTFNLNAFVLCISVLFTSDLSFTGTYWVSSNGTSSWANCEGTTPLNGPNACSLPTANANAKAGDLVYLRGGLYINQELHPTTSGTPNQRIIFKRYKKEEVIIQDSAYGIYMKQKSHITVDGIKFYSHKRWMRLYACHHIEISHCTFDGRSPSSGDWVGALIADDPNTPPPASEDSTHNWVHDCSFFRWAYGGYTDHKGALLDIGSSQTEGDDSSYNLIENNVFAYGGHHTIGVYSKFNVIRNNYIHNETNSKEWNFEGYRGALTEGPSAGWCLYEGNRFGYSKASGISLRSPNNIFRFNLFYHNGSGGMQIVSNKAGVDHADYNHIYNNDYYHNGHLATYPGFQGGIYFSSWGGVSPIDNVVKNNIFYANKNGSITYDGVVDPQIIENNWDQNSVNPGFIKLPGPDPNNPGMFDFRLVKSSPAKNKGAQLTSIVGPIGTSHSFQVEDACYFTDGWGAIDGDMIQLAGSKQTARIISVDYGTNTITVDKKLKYKKGQGLGLTYKGPAPDLGAFEILRLYPPKKF